MLKTEIICESCNNQFIIVSIDDKIVPEYCSFCASPFPEENELDLGSSE